MDFPQLANLGEFIGGVAVPVTLAYLAIQVRAGNTFARDNTSHNWTEFNCSLATGVVEGRSLAVLWTRAEGRFRELDAIDQQRVMMWRLLRKQLAGMLSHYPKLAKFKIFALITVDGPRS